MARDNREQAGSEASLAGCPAISDYAIIGDCRTAALVSRDGSIDWLCLPDFSSPSVFAALLDPHAGGRFRISPDSVRSVERRYLPHTNVLETTFTTADGRMQILDCMPISETSGDGLRPDREILRIVRTVEGSPSAHIVFQPRPGYAKALPRIESRGDWGWLCSSARDAVLLRSDVALQQDDGLCAVVGDLELAAGETRCFSLSYAHGQPLVYPGLGADAVRRCETTVRWWEDWCGQCCFDGPYADAVQRSVLTLKLLTCTLSGAVVAAPTASLPEAIGGERNWDYRYCWLRDASLMLNAFVELGYMAEGQAFVDWLIHSTRLTAPELQVMYDIYGNTDLQEWTVKRFAGYRGSRPVRVGNKAEGQLQLDIYGSVIAAAYDLLLRGGDLDKRELKMLVGFGLVVLRRWQEPDEGIWEYRNGRRHNTYSKAMCWVVLDRLISLHDDNGVDLPRERFVEGRDAIRRSIDCHGYDERLSSYVGAFGGETMDAALLLMARCRYVEPDDPRMRGTYHRIERQLGRNGMLYRYPLGSDGMSGDEGTFTACGFWAAEYLARRGEPEAARGKMEHLLGYANDVGLFSEEIDPDSGAALGNFPQAFSHSALINAALAIDTAENGGRQRSCA